MRTYSDAKEYAKFILKLYETTNTNINKMSKKYRIANSSGRHEVKLEPDDSAWLHLRNYRFSELHKSTLIPKLTDHFKIIEKISDNAHKLQLSPMSEVSPVFNIVDLKLYLEKKRMSLSRR